MIPLRYSRNFHRLIPDEGHCLHFQWSRLIDTGRCHDSKLCKVTSGFGLWCRLRVCGALKRIHHHLSTRWHIWHLRRRSRMIIDPRNWGSVVRLDRMNDPFDGNLYWNVLIIDVVGITFLLHRSLFYTSSLCQREAQIPLANQFIPKWCDDKDRPPLKVEAVLRFSHEC